MYGSPGTKTIHPVSSVSKPLNMAVSSTSWWTDRQMQMRAFPPPLPHRLESLQGPSYTNWLIKGHILIGPHPGNNRNDEFVKHIHAILQAGITTFVCLQQELPVSFSDKEDAGIHHIATKTSGLVRSAFGRANVVTASPYQDVISTMVSTGKYPQFPDNVKPAFVHFPISNLDGGVASDEEISKFIIQLMSYIKAGESLYIQCGDGNGRSGTVAAILLGIIYGMSSSEALDATQRSRDFRQGAGGPCFETHEQKMQVHRLLSRNDLRQKALNIHPHRCTASTSQSDKQTMESVTSTTEMISSLGFRQAIQRIREQLRRRGCASFILFRRYLRGDVPNNQANARMLTQRQFGSALHQFGIQVSQDEFSAIWNTLTKQASIRQANMNEQRIDTAVFCDAILTPLNEARASAVDKTFHLMDVDQDGFVEMNDIAILFTPSAHPDVQANRRTDQQVLSEFLDTFPGAKQMLQQTRGATSLRLTPSVANNTHNNQTRSSEQRGMRYIDLTTFKRYYADLGTAIDDDNYFLMMLWNVWPVRGRKSHPDEMLLQGRHLMNTEYSAVSNQNHSSNSVHAAPTNLHDSVEQLKRALVHIDENALSHLITRLENSDSQNSGTDDEFGFIQAIRDCGITVSTCSDAFLHTLFIALAESNDGATSPRISIDKFRTTLLNPLSEKRQHVISSCFQSLVSQAERAFPGCGRGRGVVPWTVVSSEYKAEHHPDVVAGRRSSEDVLCSFLNAFRSPRMPDPVDYPYFERYFTGVSTAMDNDEAFSLLLLSVWNVNRGGSGNEKNGVGVTYSNTALYERATNNEKSFVDALDRLGGDDNRRHRVIPDSQQSRSTRRHVQPSRHGESRERLFSDHVRPQTPGLAQGNSYGSRAGYGVGAATAAGVALSPNKSATWQREQQKDQTPYRASHSARHQALAQERRQYQELQQSLKPSANTVNVTQTTPVRPPDVNGHLNHRSPIIHHQSHVPDASPYAQSSRQIAAQQGVGSQSYNPQAASIASLGDPSQNGRGSSYLDPFSAYRSTEKDGSHFTFGRDRGKKTDYSSKANVASLLSNTHTETTSERMDNDLESILAQIRMYCTNRTNGRSLRTLFALIERLRATGKPLNSQYSMQSQSVASADDILTAFKEFALPISASQIQAMVSYWQVPSHPQMISVDSLIDALCPQLPPARYSVVQNAWNKLVRDFGGLNGSHHTTKRPVESPSSVSLDFARMNYDSRNHPDVSSQKREESDELAEFLETFPFGEKSAQYGQDAPNGDLFVTFDDFNWYYRCVSAAIPDERTFVYTVWCVWHLENATTDGSKNAGAATPAAATIDVRATRRTSSQPNSPRSADAGTSIHDDTINRYEPVARLDHVKDNFRGWGVEQLGWSTTEHPVIRAAPSDPKSIAAAISCTNVCSRLLRSLRQRGPFAMLQLWTKLRQADSGVKFEGKPSGSVSRNEFKRVVLDESLGLSDAEIIALFRDFPGSQSDMTSVANGALNYEYFVFAIAGSLPPARANLIQQAWQKIVSGSARSNGTAVSITDLSAALSMRQHREVVTGKMNEHRAKQLVLTPVRSLLGIRDDAIPAIVQGLFEAVYHVISACVEDDMAFQWLIWNQYLGIGQRQL